MSPKVVALISSGRYKQEHYEDVAKALKENRDWALQLDNIHARTVMAAIIGTFADLFAVDNPPSEKDCLCHECRGFNREKFLAACGLKSEAWPNADGECSGSATCMDHPESEG